jgi:hypothetical protein
MLLIRSHAGESKPWRNFYGRIAILKLIKDGLRDENLAVYFRQDFDVSEEHQIVGGGFDEFKH